VKPGESEAIGLTYHAEHAVQRQIVRCWPSQISTIASLFIQWQAIKELELNQARDPDNTSLWNMLGMNAYRASSY
jgi:hypothetical protein